MIPDLREIQEQVRQVRIEVQNHPEVIKAEGHRPVRGDRVRVDKGGREERAIAREEGEET